MEYTLDEPKYLVLHHFVNGKIGVAKEKALVTATKKLNPREYHYVVYSDGSWEGWQKEGLVAAHCGADNQAQSRCGAHNFNSIGVCCMGNFEKGPMEEKQLSGLLALVRDIATRYGIVPENILPHSAIAPTACPGKYFPLLEARQAADIPLVRVAINSDQALVMGRPNKMPLKLALDRGHAVAPLRWFCEVLGLRVVFLRDGGIVEVRKKFV